MQREAAVQFRDGNAVDSVARTDAYSRAPMQWQRAK